MKGDDFYVEPGDYDGIVVNAPAFHSVRVLLYQVHKYALVTQRIGPNDKHLYRLGQKIRVRIEHVPVDDQEGVIYMRAREIPR